MKKQNTNRKRGRPPYTGRWQANDALLLPQIAERKLVNPHQPVASIVRELIDERDTGGVRRLQRAFRLQGDSLIRAAAQRRHEQKMREINERMMRFCEGASKFAEALTGRVEAWFRSPEGQKFTELCERFERAASTPEARKWLALASSPRF